jgi:hypothetical protein
MLGLGVMVLNDYIILDDLPFHSVDQLESFCNFPFSCDTPINLHFEAVDSISFYTFVFVSLHLWYSIMEKQIEAEMAEGKNQRYSDAGSGNDILNEFTPQEEKKIMHKVDRRLVLMVGIMYWYVSRQHQTCSY